MIHVSHSCGDCGFLSAGEDFYAHNRRTWHRLVMKVGLDAALDSPAANLLDARRAVAMFRGSPSPEAGQP